MYKQKKICALLPMKDNSERVPGKNFKPFNGVPLFHVVLKQIIQSKYIDEVIINTDSQRIIDDVRLNFPQVKIHLRPEEIRGDYVSMNLIIEHDIHNTDADVYIQTHSTSPLLSTESLDNSIALFCNQEEKDSLFTVTRYQSRFYWKNGEAINHNPNELLRTQDLPPIYEENSNFYLFTKNSFFENDKKRIGKNPIMFEISRIEATDIDEPQDFIIAEALHKAIHLKN